MPDATPPSNGHRAFPRVPIGYRVKVVTDDQMIAYASALNVSQGGLLLEPTPALAPGRPCGVAIFLMDQETGKRIVARGIVVRSDPHGTAIQFTKPLEAENRALMEALIHSRTPGDPAFGTDIGAAG
ncbi:MAG TPA: PilZ domain-containing protein [Holophagaceae bacterium]